MCSHGPYVLSLYTVRGGVYPQRQLTVGSFTTGKCRHPSPDIGTMLTLLRSRKKHTAQFSRWVVEMPFLGILREKGKINLQWQRLPEGWQKVDCQRQRQSSSMTKKVFVVTEVATYLKWMHCICKLYTEGLFPLYYCDYIQKMKTSTWIQQK